MILRAKIRWIVILFWKFLAFVGISILVLSRQSHPTDSPPCAGGGANTNLQRHLVRRQADQIQQTVVSILIVFGTRDTRGTLIVYYRVCTANSPE